MAAAKSSWKAFALIAGVLLPLTALPADLGPADVWPAHDAYLQCGRDFVRNSSAPTAEGAHARCDSKLETFLLAVRNTTRIEQKRDGVSAAEIEERVAKKVATTREYMLARLTGSVNEWIAEKAH